MRNRIGTPSWCQSGVSREICASAYQADQVTLIMGETLLGTTGAGPTAAGLALGQTHTIRRRAAETVTPWR
jgi:hypothetical protein